MLPQDVVDTLSDEAHKLARGMAGLMRELSDASETPHDHLVQFGAPLIIPTSFVILHPFCQLARSACPPFICISVRSPRPSQPFSPGLKWPHLPPLPSTLGIAAPRSKTLSPSFHPLVQPSLHLLFMFCKSSHNTSLFPCLPYNDKRSAFLSFRTSYPHWPLPVA